MSYGNRTLPDSRESGDEAKADRQTANNANRHTKRSISTQRQANYLSDIGIVRQTDIRKDIQAYSVCC